MPSLLMTCNLCMAMKTKQKQTRKVGNYERKNFSSQTLHTSLLLGLELLRKSMSLSRFQHSYSILQLWCEFPTDTSSHFTHLSQNFFSKTWELLSWYSGYYWSFLLNRKEQLKTRDTKTTFQNFFVTQEEKKKTQHFCITIWIPQIQILRL